MIKTKFFLSESYKKLQKFTLTAHIAKEIDSKTKDLKEDNFFLHSKETPEGQIDPNVKNQILD